MSVFLGRNQEVGLSKETTRGTVPAAVSAWVRKTEITVKDMPEYFVDESNVGRVEYAIGGEIAQKRVEGDLKGIIYDQSFGYILDALFGTVSSATKGGESAVYEHTYTVLNDLQCRSLSINVKNPNEHLVYALAVLDSLEIKAEVGKPVEYTAKFKGAKAGVASTKTPSYSTEYYFLGKGVTFKHADTQANLTSASATSVRSINLKFTRNAEPDDVLGNVEATDIYSKTFKIEFTIVYVNSATTLKGYYTAGTMRAMRFNFVNSGTTIGTASNPNLQIDLNQVLFTNYEETSGMDDVNLATISGVATYKVADTKMVQAILTNTKANYSA